MALRSREVGAAVGTAVLGGLLLVLAQFLPAVVRPGTGTAGVVSFLQSVASTATVLLAAAVAYRVADDGTDVLALGGAFGLAGAVSFGLGVALFVLAPPPAVVVPAPVLVAVSTVVNAAVPFALAAVAGAALRRLRTQPI